MANIQQIDILLKQNTHEKKLLTKRKKELIDEQINENIEKKTKLTNIIKTQNMIDKQIDENYEKIYSLEEEISSLKDKRYEIEKEKCYITSHIWIDDHSYASVPGDLVCDRCGLFGNKN